MSVELPNCVDVLLNQVFLWPKMNHESLYSESPKVGQNYHLMEVITHWNRTRKKKWECSSVVFFRLSKWQDLSITFPTKRRAETSNFPPAGRHRRTFTDRRRKKEQKVSQFEWNGRVWGRKSAKYKYGRSQSSQLSEHYRCVGDDCSPSLLISLRFFSSPNIVGTHVLHYVAELSIANPRLLVPDTGGY